MEKTQRPIQEFSVKVIHGDYRKGRGHWFRAIALSGNRIYARFDMKTEEGYSEAVEIDDLVRIEQTTSGRFKVGDWMKHYLLPHTTSMLTAAASLEQLQGMERESRRVRFVCTTADKYFCGEMARNGFRLAQELVQQAKQADQENLR